MIPVTGSGTVNLQPGRNTMVLPSGGSASFNVTGSNFSASLAVEDEGSIPGTLPAGLTFLDAMTYTIFQDGAVIGTLPDGQSVTYSFLLPAGVSPDALKVLSWDATANGGLGDWVELSAITVTADGFVVFTGNGGGTFVLASE